MAIIPVTYDAKGAPYVTGLVAIKNHVFSPPLKFMIDTAAQRSFIIPSHELLLKTSDRKMWQNIEFCSAGKPIVTIMGCAPIKYVSNGVLIILPDVEGGEYHTPLPRLNFAADKPSLSSFRRAFVPRKTLWDRAGDGRDHSLLGRDLMSKLALVSVQSGRCGILTDDHRALRGNARNETFKKLNKFFDEI